MIVYVGFAQPDEWADWARTYAAHAARFEEAAGGDLCLVVPYHRVDRELVRRLRPDALVLSGFSRSWQDYDIRAMHPLGRCVLEEERIPLLALCGGHQMVGFLFGGALLGAERLCDEPMRRRRPGEPITNPDYHPEYYMERGFHELELHGEDPLFAGCGRPPVVLESHYCEVKALPPGFRLLASTPECRIQAMRHESRPLVSLQFHPEDYTDAFPDGRAILRNFLGGIGR